MNAVSSYLDQRKSAFHKGSLAGAALFLSGFIIFMGIITAETYYPPGYNTKTNEISDLGATRPPDSVSFQPSAAIFDGSMIASGLLVLIAAYLLFSMRTRKLFTIPLGLFGTGVLGVGLFPGNTTPHVFFALLTFLSGGMSALMSARITRPPFSYIAIFCGSVGLIALFFAAALIPFIGDGGAERWVAYPITLWLSTYGAYMLGSNAQTSRKI